MIVTAVLLCTTVFTAAANAGDSVFVTVDTDSFGDEIESITNTTEALSIDGNVYDFASGMSKSLR